MYIYTIQHTLIRSARMALLLWVCSAKTRHTQQAREFVDTGPEPQQALIQLWPTGSALPSD